MYTSHGHHISGTVKGERPNTTVRCGGPKTCNTCFSEALAENTRIQNEKQGGSMFMSPYQMHQVAAKMRANNPKPKDSVATRQEFLLHKTLFEFAKAMDDVADDIENGN
jgi:hypothetical protein